MVARLRSASHFDSPLPTRTQPIRQTKGTYLDKPVKQRPPLTDLIPIAVLKPDDAMTFEWLEDLINTLRTRAGLEPLTSEELNSPLDE